MKFRSVRFLSDLKLFVLFFNLGFFFHPRQTTAPLLNVDQEKIKQEAKMQPPAVIDINIPNAPVNEIHPFNIGLKRQASSQASSLANAGTKTNSASSSSLSGSASGGSKSSASKR
jgi:hypothetical protein